MKTLSTFLAAAGLFLFAGSLSADQHSLIAVLEPTEGNDVEGHVTFTKSGDGVTIEAKVGGLEPNSRHGFHIHEFGDISAADGTSAGGHFNPEGHDHGLPDEEPRHAGDLGNLEADEDGMATMSRTVDDITLTEGANAVLGRGVVVHAKPDDGGQPTGNAGPRIAVGTIGIRNPNTPSALASSVNAGAENPLSELAEEAGETAEATGEAVTEGTEEVADGIGEALTRAADALEEAAEPKSE